MRSQLFVNRHPVRVFTFPGGEVQVRVPDAALNGSAYVDVKALIADSDGVMALVLLRSILDTPAIEQVNLYMPYIPYARQDRVCASGEAFSAKAFAGLINSLNFGRVFVTDPHSPVSGALLSNVEVTSQKEVIIRSPLYEKLQNKELFVVAPDFGASKKAQEIADIGTHIATQGTKLRDPETGELSGFDYYGDVEGEDLLIVDDICDGGATFLGLAQELREGGANSVHLFVTHGIFSKGLSVFDGVIDSITTTDSFPHPSDIEVVAELAYKGEFNVIKLHPIIS